MPKNSMTQHVCSPHLPLPGLLTATGLGIGPAKAVCVGQHVLTCGIAGLCHWYDSMGVRSLQRVDDCGLEQAK